MAENWMDDEEQIIQCWQCYGAGRVPGCFEDCCSGADCDPDEVDLCCAPRRCDVCKGKGGWPRTQKVSGMAEQIEKLIEGLRQAIRDPECPVQFSPLLWECKQVLTAIAKAEGTTLTKGEGMAMDKKTLQALNGSIKKWELIVAGDGLDRGDENCPLCKMFKTTAEDDSACEGCPVAIRSGMGYCKNTPYQKWLHAENEIHHSNHNKAITPKLKQAAQAELDFLRSLLLPAEASTPPSAVSHTPDLMVREFPR